MNSATQPTTYLQSEVIRLALQFALANRGNAALLQNDESRDMLEACEVLYSRLAQEQRG